MRTIENRADKDSSEIDLFLNVQVIWNLGSVRIAGPRSPPGVRHGHEGEDLSGAQTDGR